jgi:hypothetical protein
MRAKATEKDRTAWHLEHAKNCACRPAPKELLSKLNGPDKSGAEKSGTPSGLRTH